MKVSRVAIRNFRRLENVDVDLDEKDTVFVGPNNSGKTSATAAFRCFFCGRDFRVHDFSASRMGAFETFTASQLENDLPAIELDIWFKVDPDNIEFGQAFALLPRLADHDKLGLRLAFSVTDSEKLLAAYDAAYPLNERSTRSKSLAQFLAVDTNLRQHWSLRY